MGPYGVMRRFRLAIAGFVFPVVLLGACSTGPSYPVVTQADADILVEAKRLLADESMWTRNEDTQCNLDATQWTLFCALQKASYNVTGTYELRRVALEDTRDVIDTMMGSETLERRLIDFNNLPTTTFADVQMVLDRALARVQGQLAERQALHSPAQ
jgi:hypothetical protein